MHFFFLTQISKCSTPTDLHHPDLHLAQFFSLESYKISYAYATKSLGLKMGKFKGNTRAEYKGGLLPWSHHLKQNPICKLTDLS